MQKKKEEVLFSADENRFRNELRDFLVREEAKQIEQEIYERDFYPREHYEKLGKKGFLAPVLPIKYGGRGKLVYEVILAEELGASCVPLAWIYSTSSYVYATIARHGSEEQKRRYLPALKKGANIGAIAITEHPVEGMSAFIVEPKAGMSETGFEVIEDYKLLGGFPGTVNSHLLFDEMCVPGENILGGTNEGAKIMFDELSIERTLYAAMLVGEARPVLELAVKYSMKREQFGTSISRFEGISFKIADMVTRLEAAKLMVYHTARLIDGGFDAEKESAISKLLASEAFYEVAHSTVQILGGRGLSDEYPAEWAFRMARLSMIPAGTNEIMRFIVQREVYKEQKGKEEE